MVSEFNNIIRALDIQISYNISFSASAEDNRGT
jgi:hypothetical protein